jgi:threonine/homoserine/homoserine lactone efflux protein
MNPKGWLVAVSGIAAYSGASPGSAFGLAATFAVLFFVAAFPSGLAWLMAGALMQKLLQDARMARAFNIVMAIVLAGSVATIFVWPETAAFIP